MSRREEENFELCDVYDPIKCGNVNASGDTMHDRGLLRAAQSRYAPNLSVKGDPNYVLFVGSLDYATSEDTLRKAFEKYGKIYRLRLVRDIVTGLSKGYAFVEFKHRSDLHRAYRDAYKRLVIDDRQVLVDYEHERLLSGWRPRRLGGGFGGKIQSGQLRFGGRYRPFKKYTRRPSSREDGNSKRLKLSK